MLNFVRRVQAFALALGAPGLFIVAFLDSSFLSLPEVSDILIVFFVIKNPPAWVFYAVMATIGSLAGCLALYEVARRGGERFLRKRFHERHIDRGLDWFKRYGLLAVGEKAVMPHGWEKGGRVGPQTTVHQPTFGLLVVSCERGDMRQSRDGIYVYGPQDDTAENWAAARATLPADVRLFAQTHLVGWAAAGRFDGVYTYDVLVFTGDRFARLCEQARKVKLLCAPSVGPGYDARRAVADARVRPRRQGKTYDGMWQSAIRAGADLVTITSYNEWHEGTQIEPARARRGYSGYDGAWGTRGKDAERAYLDRTAYWTARLRRGW